MNENCRKMDINLNSICNCCRSNNDRCTCDSFKEQLKNCFVLCVGLAILFLSYIFDENLEV